MQIENSMLRVSNLGYKLVSQGYHFDNHGRKFIQVWSSLYNLKIKIKIEQHKEMHIHAIDASFPYNINDNWVEIVVDYQDIDKDFLGIETYVNTRCEEVWFV